MKRKETEERREESKRKGEVRVRDYTNREGRERKEEKRNR